MNIQLIRKLNLQGDKCRRGYLHIARMQRIANRTRPLDSGDQQRENHRKAENELYSRENHGANRAVFSRAIVVKVRGHKKPRQNQRGNKYAAKNACVNASVFLHTCRLPF